jgi:8-oxo-dGTP pyrophosphatase MutT (NUDIX family)
LQALAAYAPHVAPEQMPLPAPPGTEARPGAVLLLFGEGPQGPDLLFIERSATLRSHAGQPAFPGGAQDPDDTDAVAAALREAAEEVGLRADAVKVFATLPTTLVPPSGFVVTPVLAYWHAPHDVGPVDVGEVAAVERVPISELVDPANRCAVGLRGGRLGPAFQVRGLLVWGFTALLTDRVLEWGGWALPWSPEPVLDRPTAPAPPLTQ